MCVLEQNKKYLLRADQKLDHFVSCANLWVMSYWLKLSLFCMNVIAPKLNVGLLYQGPIFQSLSPLRTHLLKLTLCTIFVPLLNSLIIIPFGKNQDFFPQVLKQVVNLSCLLRCYKCFGILDRITGSVHSKLICINVNFE